MKMRRFLMRITEFVIMGIILGMIEDLLAITFATDSEITIKTISIVFLSALPFAIVSELIVDSKRFNDFMKKIFKVRD